MPSANALSRTASAAVANLNVMSSDDGIARLDLLDEPSMVLDRLGPEEAVDGGQPSPESRTKGANGAEQVPRAHAAPRLFLQSSSGERLAINRVTARMNRARSDSGTYLENL